MKPKKRSAPKPEKPKTVKIKEPHRLDALMADLREKLQAAGVDGLKIKMVVEVGKATAPGESDTKPPA
jgi:hypothetical protein